MLNELTELFNQFKAYSNQNPIVAGAVSLWGLSVISFLFRNVPTKVWGFLKRQFTTSLSFTNDTQGRLVETFGSFMEWFEKNQWADLSRTLAIDGSYTDQGTVISAGSGLHFFRYKGRTFWLYREALVGTNSYTLKYQVTITTYGRNRGVFSDLIQEFRYIQKKDKVGIFMFRENAWVRQTDIDKRDLHTVVCKKEIKDQILADVDWFKSSRDWYTKRGIPYKKTFILHGVPGTGKTSLIKALASHYEMNLCVINLTQMSDTQLMLALTSTPQGSFIILEDFDSTKATHARAGLELIKKTPGASDPVPNKSRDVAEPEFTFLTLSGILNALDGLVSLSDKVIFMTTNRLEIMDEALVRKGRVDRILELGCLETPEIQEYIRLMFPDYIQDLDLQYAPILGCDLQDLYFASSNDPIAFSTSIPR